MSILLCVSIERYHCVKTPLFTKCLRTSTIHWRKINDAKRCKTYLGVSKPILECLLNWFPKFIAEILNAGGKSRGNVFCYNLLYSERIVTEIRFVSRKGPSKIDDVQSRKIGVIERGNCNC